MDERLRRTVETYESVADQYADRHADRSGVAEMVRAFLDSLDGRRVLDVGCGPGWETATFADEGLDVTGIDLSPSFLAGARDRTPAGSFARADMRSLPFQSGAFDGIWACASLLHVPRDDVGGTLSEFHRVLADDGLLVASLKRADSTGVAPSPYEEDERHFERYERDSLRSIVTASGFDVVDCVRSERWLRVRART